MKKLMLDLGSLLSDYNSGLALDAIARKHNISQASVSVWVRRHPDFVNRGYPLKRTCHPIVNGRRVCKTCLIDKPLNQFPKHKRSLNLGVLAHCCDCTAKSRSEYSARLYLDLRKRVIDGYGGMCAECGYLDHRAMHIDHVNNDGAEERRRRGVVGIQLLRKIIAHDFPADYQLLCANCNTIKAHESGSFTRAREAY